MAKDTKKTSEDQNRNQNQNKGSGTSDDPVRVAVVEDPTEGAFTAGEALTPEQRAGLEPLDPERDAEQAEDRENLTNMQTDHEADNTLDPVSGDPNPGVTEDAPLTARATGAPVTDMSGRPAMTADDKKHISRVREKLEQAQTDDGKNDKMEDDRRGWRTPLDIGVPGSVMTRMYESGEYPLERETVPNGHFFPETGHRYRIGSGSRKSSEGKSAKK